MPNCFIVQLLKGKGPDPAQEIAAVIAESRASERGHAILGTRRTGKDWKSWRPDFAVVFYRTDDGTISGLVAEIANYLKDPKNIPPIYEASVKEMKGWWHLKKPRPFRPGVTIDDIPGHSATGPLRAPSTFDGNCTFAYWDFDESPFDALCAPESDVAPKSRRNTS
jgi:hypothetical protein